MFIGGVRKIGNGKKAKALKYIGYLLMLISFVYLAKMIWSYKTKINFSLIKHPYSAIGYFLLTMVGFVVVVYISSFAWKQILEFLYGKKIDYGEIRDVYVKANIGKYLPGNVMHFAGRNMLGKKLGFSHFDMALSSVTEVLVLIITSCIWAAILAFESFKQVLKKKVETTNHIFLSAIIAVIFVVAVVAIVFAIKKGYMKKLHKLFTKGSYKLFIKLFLIYSFTLIVPGIFLVFIFTQVLGQSMTLHYLLLTIAAYIISWVIGYIVPVPGGLGVREAVLTFILGATPMTIVAILLHRVASILGDAVAFFAEVCLSHKTMKG
jgi:uncharacterized membrane protein YbhN (UPF0104 family)